MAHPNEDRCAAQGLRASYRDRCDRPQSCSGQAFAVGALAGSVMEWSADQMRPRYACSVATVYSLAPGQTIRQVDAALLQDMFARRIAPAAQGHASGRQFVELEFWVWMAIQWRALQFLQQVTLSFP